MGSWCRTEPKYAYQSRLPFYCELKERDWSTTTYSSDKYFPGVDHGGHVWLSREARDWIKDETNIDRYYVGRTHRSGKNIRIADLPKGYRTKNYKEFKIIFIISFATEEDLVTFKLGYL